MAICALDFANHLIVNNTYWVDVIFKSFGWIMCRSESFDHLGSSTCSSIGCCRMVLSLRKVNSRCENFSSWGSAYPSYSLHDLDSLAAYTDCSAYPCGKPTGSVLLFFVQSICITSYLGQQCSRWWVPHFRMWLKAILLWFAETRKVY